MAEGGDASGLKPLCRRYFQQQNRYSSVFMRQRRLESAASSGQRNGGGLRPYGNCVIPLCGGSPGIINIRRNRDYGRKRFSLRKRFVMLEREL